MGSIPNTIPVPGMIAPTGTTDLYATHSDIYGQGGFRIVTSLTERNAISFERRKVGMIVGVDVNNDGNTIYYKLKKVNWNYTSDDWEEWKINGSTTNKQVAYGDNNNNITSSSNFIYDYTTQTLKLYGKNEENTNILEVNDYSELPIFGVDTNKTVKIYDSTGNKYVGIKTPNLDSNIIYTLPAAIGSPGTTLINDGTGILSWESLNVNGNKGYSEEIQADGNTKSWTITHGLQTTNVMVQFFSNTTFKNIEIEIIRTDLNTVQINSPINLPIGSYTILVASMIYSGISLPSVGGSGGSIQFNYNNTLEGDDYFKYIYDLSDNGKRVELLTQWGNNNTEGSLNVCVKTEDELSSKLLVSLGRLNKSTSDVQPIDIREGGLSLYSSYNDALKAFLHGGGENSGTLELYSSSIQTVKLSETSYLLGTLTLGSQSYEDNSILAIKAVNVALNIYDSDDTNNVTILSNGTIKTNGTLKVGDVAEENAEQVLGNIRYDSITNYFYGYKGETQGWVVLG